MARSPVITFLRIDGRLIHGQVVEAWLPGLKVSRVVVADDEAAHSPLMKTAMGLAVPPELEVDIRPLGEVPFAALAEDSVRTLLLLRDIPALIEARKRGLPVSRVNLGNVHHGPMRRQVSASVFLNAEELEQLKALHDQGVEIEARGVPSERPVTFSEMVERFGKR
ncbi:MAG TPA: PTS sugar transporter subunit IIB [Myxococcaceae bacterium]|nr:PTS sugar transporter subunit IIB [Myxococcaceae bacterium]